MRCLRDDGGLGFGNVGSDSVLVSSYLFIFYLPIACVEIESVRFIYVENRFQTPFLFVYIFLLVD